MNRSQAQFVKDALDQSEKLSGWEYDFINSLAEYDGDKPLSDRQNEILNRIQRKLD